MRAIVISEPGGPEVLRIEDRPEPIPHGAEVLVRIQASGVNRADLLQRRGLYPAPPGDPPDIPGLEFAGVVERLGPTTAGTWTPGDRVMGIVGGGGYTEAITVHERTLIPIPSALDLPEAAAIPEAFLTAFDALTVQGQLQPGQRVLIHAVGSGVGTAAVQLAHVMGCETFGTSRTASKLEHAQTLGLDHGIDSSRHHVAQVLKDLTQGRGVDLVIDFLGATMLEANLKVLAPRGRLVIVGLLTGAQTEVDLSLIMRKRLTVVGTVLRARPIEEKIVLATTFRNRVLPWFERGRIRPIVDRTMPLEDAGEAHRALEANQTTGKIVLVMPTTR